MPEPPALSLSATCACGAGVQFYADQPNVETVMANYQMWVELHKDHGDKWLDKHEHRPGSTGSLLGDLMSGGAHGFIRLPSGEEVTDEPDEGPDGSGDET